MGVCTHSLESVQCLCPQAIHVTEGKWTLPLNLKEVHGLTLRENNLEEESKRAISSRKMSLSHFRTVDTATKRGGSRRRRLSRSPSDERKTILTYGVIRSHIRKQATVVKWKRYQRGSSTRSTATDT